MNKERLKLWVDALRSGKYTRTRHHYRQHNEFCAVGVAADVAIKNGYKGVEWVTEDGYVHLRYVTKGPAAATGKWYGLTLEEMSTISNLNDFTNLSFEETATYIEELMNNE